MNEVTAYCLCVLCCGSTPDTAANGRSPVVGVTVAAPRAVPFGTWVEISIPGMSPMRRRVDDRLSRRWDHRWDVLVESHAAARQFGVRKGTIRVITP